jgi:hypothetical protein
MLFLPAVHCRLLMKSFKEIPYDELDAKRI